MYARKQAEEVIEWMYSAFKQSTSADKTFNEITSAGKNDLTSAISDIRTYVGKLENGEYVSTAALSSAVSNAVSSSISGLATEAYVNSATANVYSRVTSDIGNAVSGLTTKSYVDTAIANVSSSVSSAIGNATAGLATEAYVNSATASLVSTATLNNAVSAASIVTSVNNAGSSVLINADKIKIDSSHQLDLSSQNITVDTSNLQIKAGNIDFGIGQCQMNGGNLYITSTPTSRGSMAEIYVVSAGNSNHDNEVSISNDRGLEVTGSDSHFFVGENGGSFRISVSGGNNNSGTGYTGTINGARFVCGICVGQA